MLFGNRTCPPPAAGPATPANPERIVWQAPGIGKARAAIGGGNRGFPAILRLIEGRFADFDVRRSLDHSSATYDSGTSPNRAARRRRGRRSVCRRGVGFSGLCFGLQGAPRPTNIRAGFRQRAVRSALRMRGRPIDDPQTGRHSMATLAWRNPGRGGTFFARNLKRRATGKPRQPRSCRSSTPRPAILWRCSVRCWKKPTACAKQRLECFARLTGRAVSPAPSTGREPRSRARSARSPNSSCGCRISVGRRLGRGA